MWTHYKFTIVSLNMTSKIRVHKNQRRAYWILTFQYSTSPTVKRFNMKLELYKPRNIKKDAFKKEHDELNWLERNASLYTSGRIVVRGRAADPQLGTNEYRFPIPYDVYGECRKRPNPIFEIHHHK